MVLVTFQLVEELFLWRSLVVSWNVVEISRKTRYFCKSHTHTEDLLLMRGNAHHWSDAQTFITLCMAWNVIETRMKLDWKLWENFEKKMSCCWFGAKMSNWKKYFSKNSFVFFVCVACAWVSLSDMTLWENVAAGRKRACKMGRTAQWYKNSDRSKWFHGGDES